MKRTIYILFAAVLLLSCGAREIKDARKILDNVESFIQERPDSALSVLEGIDKSNLNNKGLKARHGLLLSMALDKNFIDLTSGRSWGLRKTTQTSASISRKCLKKCKFLGKLFGIYPPPLNLQKTPENDHFENIRSICNGIIPQH